jgi:PAP2 superfamily
MQRRHFLALSSAAFIAPSLPILAAPGKDPRDVLFNWYRMVMELVRHTPTCSPPYAARAFGYLGVAVYESIASGTPDLMSMAGQLDGLTPLPARDPGQTYDDAVLMQAAITAVVDRMFDHTGPAGQRAKTSYGAKQKAAAAQGLPDDIVLMSQTYGQAIAAHVLAWAETDGGAVVDNMGFPHAYAMPEGPEYWQPTSTIRMQQMPLLPLWGGNRFFVKAAGTDPVLPPPLAYSEETGSDFHTQAMEVYDTFNALTPDQKALAQFWSDDPLLTATPAGHGSAIAILALQQAGSDLHTCVDVLMRAGVAQSDAMTAAWREKYIYNRLRPISYIRRVIDPKWEPLLITPPFPEYPSGHSVQSGCLAAVLTPVFGAGFAFTDTTGEDDGLTPRRFADFDAAALEAGMSRLYGGIHFRAAIENGLKYGHALGLVHSNALKTVAA